MSLEHRWDWLFLIAILCAGTTLYSDFSKKAATPFFTLSITLSALVTTCIAVCLLQFESRMESALGREDVRASPCTSIAAVFIESSSLYAPWSLVFIIAYTVCLFLMPVAAWNALY